jgi:hypothetical protein
MIAKLRNTITGLTICAMLVTTAIKPAVADRPRPANTIPTKSDVVWIGVGIAAIGAGIAIGIILAVGHHNHNMTGCAASGPDGLQLLSESDQQTYALVGNVAGIKAGDRVRVSGKKQKTGAGGSRQLLVDKLGKDFGPCAVSPAHP